MPNLLQAHAATENEKILAQRENLLFSTSWTAVLSSPDFVTFLSHSSSERGVTQTSVHSYKFPQMAWLALTRLDIIKLLGEKGMNVGVVNRPTQHKKLTMQVGMELLELWLKMLSFTFVVTSWVLIQGFHFTGLLYTRKILLDCQTRWAKFFSQLVNSHPLIKPH